MGKIIGIDLGTTNSVVSVMERGETKVIPNQEGSNTTPSIVGFTKDGEVLVGQVAKRQAITNPENTIFSVKRFMGRKYSEISEELKMVPYEVVQGKGDAANIQVNGKEMTPQEISSKVLTKLKQAAEDYLGEPVTEAVITVPAYFNDSQRKATQDAGKIAGLEVKRIVNEPTAAALAYGLDKKGNELVAVFDFGGGTFDISILEVGDKVVEVLSTNGDTHLGGDNLDQEIIHYLIDEFKKDQGVDVSQDKMVLQRLKEAAEKAKIELSSTVETEINLPFLTADASGPKHLNIKLTRAKFEALVDKHISACFEPIKKALADADKKASDIDEIVLVGGSTRIPKVQSEVEKFFGKAPHKGVNPDEVVAVGAAVQAGVLSGDVKDVLLLDVTPLTLGIETKGGVMTALIERNTTIPTQKSQVFSTAADNQTSVEIHILQGERPMASDNKSLGKFVLDEIPPAPMGMPQIEVSFDIDSNGVVNVSATDKGTGKKQNITITASTSLSQDEVEELVKEAKRNESSDKKKRDLIEAKNTGDSLVYASEKSLKDNGDKIDEGTKKAIESAIESLKKALEGENVEMIKSETEKLQQASHKLAEAIYKEQADAQGENSSSNSGAEETAKKGDDDVVDAEFEEAKDE